MHAAQSGMHKACVTVQHDTSHYKAINHKCSLHVHAWDNYHRIAACMRSEHARINMHARVVLEAWPNGV